MGKGANLMEVTAQFNEHRAGRLLTSCLGKPHVGFLSCGFFSSQGLRCPDDAGLQSGTDRLMRVGPVDASARHRVQTDGDAAGSQAALVIDRPEHLEIVMPRSQQVGGQKGP